MRICFEIDKCKSIGKGAECEVYLTNEGYVIKSFYNQNLYLLNSYVYFNVSIYCVNSSLNLL